MASILATFEKIISERLRNILKRSFKGHKTVNKHAINLISYYQKKMMRSGYAVSSHSGLMPSETVYENRGLLWPIARKENFINVR